MFSSYRRPSCQTLSNAFDKSNKTLEGLASNTVIILWVIEINWLTQELLSLKPNRVILVFYCKLKNSIKKQAFQKL